MSARVIRWRAATEADIEFLADVVIEATRHQGRWPADLDETGFRAGFVEWTAKQVRNEIPGSTTFVIEADGKPAGRLRVMRDAERVELAGIQLMPRHQARGIGTHVVREVIAQAGLAGLRFELNVEKDNPRARALYERLGLVCDFETDDADHMVWPTSITGA